MIVSKLNQLIFFNLNACFFLKLTHNGMSACLS